MAGQFSLFNRKLKQLPVRPAFKDEGDNPAKVTTKRISDEADDSDLEDVFRSTAKPTDTKGKRRKAKQVDDTKEPVILASSSDEDDVLDVIDSDSNSKVQLDEIDQLFQTAPTDRPLRSTANVSVSSTRGRKSSRGKGRQARKSPRGSTKKGKKLASLNLSQELRNLDNLTTGVATHQMLDSEDDDIICLNEEVPNSQAQKEIRLKINYKGDVKRLLVKRDVSFWAILDDIVNLCGIEKAKIALSLDSKDISFDETPNSLNLTLVSILDCYERVTQETSKSRSNSTEDDDPNSISIKIRSNLDTRAHSVTMKISKLDQLSVLMVRYANDLKLPFKKLIFEFDGDRLNGTETAVDLEMENDSLIDVKVKK